jgi:tRNA pseudouridine38-40 synthase
MARYQLILAYDGTEFSGFQRQSETRTVQKVIESALRELNWAEETIFFAGRTDSGVHASGQVVSFSLEWKHSDETLISALNARFPSDVSGLSISKVEAEFHPRYDASSRSYSYNLYHLPEKQPLLDRYAWRVWPALSGDLLENAAQQFIGEYDFSAFGRAMKPGSSTIRRVLESHWTQTDGGWHYTIRANAFLYHMVRRLVYLQVQTARGRVTIADLNEALTTGKKLNPGLAPANGLVLTNVQYEIGRHGLLSENENLN